MSPSPAFPPAYFLALGVLCGVVGFRVGWRARHRLVLPFVQGLLGWVAFSYAWRIHGPAMAAAAVGCWAAATTLVSLYFFVGEPRATDARVLRAASYRTAMLEELLTAGAPTARSLATVRARVHEFVVYLAAATLTANFAALVFGAILLNAMNAWVATLLRAARRPGIVALLGWPSWRVVRVAAFVATGTAAAAPLGARLGYPAPPGAIRPLVVAGAVGLLIDLVLELAWSRRRAERLAAAVDLTAAAANRGHEEPFHLGLDEAGADTGEQDPTAPRN